MSVIIVTGASTGIGQEAALHLSRAGHTVYAGVRNPATATGLSAAIDQQQLSVVVLPLDITDQNSVDQAVATVMDQQGRIDVLVSNAGIGLGGPVEEVSLDAVRDMFETNYIGSCRMMQAVAPILRQQRAGRFVNVTSSAAKIVAGTHAHYSATKWALEGMSEALAIEMAEFGVKVAIVQPGVTITPMWEKGEPPADNSPYAAGSARLGALFAHGFKNPATTADVAVVIEEAINAEPPRFRYPVGEEAVEMIAAREKVGEEEWMTVNCLQGEEFYDRWQEMVGKDYFRG
jgi:NAD(P)-dependent dehydrogenase (short-subunit alcohol dehydrogenase family)